eukprot:g14950.t1
MKRARSKHLFSRKRKQSAAGEPHCPAPGTEEVYVNSFGTIITEGLRRFEEHYRPQCLADGSEWAKLAHSLRQPLPAVVAALLLRTGAVLEVVPDLQGLPTRPGLTTWTVEELHGPEGLTKAQRKRFRRSMLLRCTAPKGETVANRM